MPSSIRDCGGGGRGGDLVRAFAPELRNAVIGGGRIVEIAAALASPEGAEAGRQLYEDEAKFIDFTRSPLWFGEEKVVFG